MFLVEDRRFGTTYLVFTWQDPREDGYTGDVIEDVSLDYDLDEVHQWPPGQPRPNASVGRAANDPKHYKVFRYDSDLQSAGYERVPGIVAVFTSWSDYIRLDPPNPELIDDEQWYDYLDKVDDASRQRSRRPHSLSQPSGGDRDEVAAWLAKKHLNADRAIREVWYLPHGAPPDEIRLLELSDQLAGSESSVEPIDFGLDLDRAHFRLVVADITRDQLEEVKQDTSRLPRGWSFQGSKTWGRRRA